MKKINTNKLILSIILLTSITTSFATSCEDAKQYLINAASQIKANHQSVDSFDLYNQDKLLKTDTDIISKAAYQDNLSFVKNNCTVS